MSRSRKQVQASLASSLPLYSGQGGFPNSVKRRAYLDFILKGSESAEQDGKLYLSFLSAKWRPLALQSPPLTPILVSCIFIVSSLDRVTAVVVLFNYSPALQLLALSCLDHQY